MRWPVQASAIYGVTRSFYGTVIPEHGVPALQNSHEYSDVYAEGNLFGGSDDMTLGPADVAVNLWCTLDNVALELLDSNGNMVQSGIHPHDTLTLVHPGQLQRRRGGDTRAGDGQRLSPRRSVRRLPPQLRHGPHAARALAVRVKPSVGGDVAYSVTGGR